MPFFRKKPVVIEARQVPTWVDSCDLVEYLDACVDLADWCGGRSYMMHSDGDKPDFYYEGDPGHDHMIIPTLEGNMMAYPGNWIICGVKNEFYPCEQSIFEMTYEPVI